MFLRLRSVSCHLELLQQGLVHVHYWLHVLAVPSRDDVAVDLCVLRNIKLHFLDISEPVSDDSEVLVVKVEGFDQRDLGTRLSQQDKH